MNKIYQIIWNVAASLWQVAGELARGRGKQSRGRRRLTLAAGALFLLPLSALGGTLPTGASIAAGEGQISQIGNELTVTQDSGRLAIDWQSFSIGEGNSVRFIQPNADAAALNRVLGPDVSRILGSLEANGQVFLVNPNGVLFGQNAQVNAGAIVASTLNISLDDFMAGDYRFEGASANSIINQGTITADGGYVALIAARIENAGNISSTAGDVLIGAGRKVRLDLGGPIKLDVEQGALDALIEQGGAIQADGGTVLLTAKAARDLAGTVINNTGIIQARTLTTGENGSIMLLGEEGAVHVAGRLDASAPHGGDGGFIETSGPRVRIEEEARITTASSTGRTGTFLIDPTDFNISEGAGTKTDSGIGADTLSGLLANTNFIIQTVADGTEDGDINVNAEVSWGASTTLTLNAHNDIHFNANVIATGDGAGLALEPGGDYFLNYGANITLSGANPSFSVNDQSYNVIQDVAALQGMALGGRYVLGTDIDASVTAAWNGGEGFKPIGFVGGTAASNFTGVFDGLGHRVYSLTANRPGAFYQGLFGKLGSNAIVQNIGLVNPTIVGGYNTGGLAGSSSATTPIRNIDIIGGSVTGNTSIGGVLGHMGAGSLDNIFSSVRVTATMGAAALVGNSVKGTVSNAYVLGSLSGSQALVGYVNGTTTIENVYAAGYVSGSSRRLAGATATLINVYYDNQTTGLPGIDGIGLSTTALQSGLPEGFDPAIWGIVEGTSYPYLLRQFGLNETPQVISGIVSGSSAAGVDISTHFDGNLVSSWNGDTVRSGANGYYYQLLDPGTIKTDSHLLVQSSGHNAAFFADGVNDHLLNADLDGNRFNVRSSSTTWSATLANLETAILDDANLSALVDGLASLKISTAGAFQIDSAIEASGSVTIESNGLLVSRSILTEDGDIEIVSGHHVDVRGAAIASSGAGDLSITAAGQVQLNSGAVRVKNGSMDIKASDMIQSINDGAFESTGAGDIRLTSTTNRIHIGGTYRGNILASGSGDIHLSALLGLGNYNGTLRGSGALTIQGYDPSLLMEIGSTSADVMEVRSGWISLIKNSDISEVTFGQADRTGHIEIVNAAFTDQDVTIQTLGDITFLGNLATTGNRTIRLDGSHINIENHGASSPSGTIIVHNSNGITLGTSATIEAEKLLLLGTGDVDMDQGTVRVGTLAADIDGSLSLRNATALKVDAIAGTSGVTASGPIHIATVAGDLSVVEDISTSDDSDSAIVLNAGENSTAGTATGGDIILSGALAFGNGGRATLFTGEIDGSTGISTTAGGSGSGRFRYNSDESATNYSAMLDAGIYAIYREQPKLSISPGLASGQYGETPNVSGLSYTVSGFINGDSSGISGTATYSTAATATDDVGKYDISYTGGLTSSLGYGFANDATSTEEYSISPRVLNLLGQRAYDGGSQLSASAFILDNLVDEEMLILSGTGTMSDKHVGTGKTVTIGDLLLADGAESGKASNYTLTGGTHTVDISQAALTLSTTDVTKTYDGGLSADGELSIVLGDVFEGDSLSGGGFAFTDANAGDNKTVTVSNASIDDGNEGKNYAITYTSNTSSTIGRAALTITADNQSAIYDGKVYDGGFSASYGGFVSDEDESVLSGSLTFAGDSQTARNAGDYSITASGLTSGNYEISFASGTLTIGRASLTVTANDKTASYDGEIYDGGFSVSYDGFVNSEDESVLDGGLSFAGDSQTARNAGDYSITASGLSARNYNISFVDGKLTINPAALTLSVADIVKTYDGTTAASGVASIASGSLFDGDSVSGDFAFTDANAGENKTVTISNVAIDDGNDGGNYTVTYANNTSSTIERAALTVTAEDLLANYDGQIYDDGFFIRYDGFVNNEDDSVINGSLVFGGTSQSARNAGRYGITAGGLSAENYQLSFVDGSLTINPATLTLSIADIVKTYDGGTAAHGEVIITAGQLFAADRLSGGDFAFTDANAGDGKTVTVSSVAIDDGNDGGNYTVTYADNTSSTITRRALTVSGISAEDKIYDGGTSAVTNLNGLTLSNFVAGDEVTLSVIGTFSDANVGEHTVSLTSLYSGSDVGNYEIASQTTTTATISPRPVTIAANNQKKIFGFSDPALTWRVEAGQLVDNDRPVGSLSREDGERLGDYRIGRGSLNHGNYDIRFEPGTLRIVPAPELDNAVFNAQVAVARPVLSPATPANNPPIASTGQSGLTFIPLDAPQDGDSQPATPQAPPPAALPLEGGGAVPVFVVSGGIRMPYDD